MKTQMRCHESGFTLIELSVVIIIIGLLMAAILAGYTTQLKRQQIIATNEHIKTAEDTLQRYQENNGFYPCPADPASSDLKALPDCSPTAILPASMKRISAGGGKFVIVGAMPILSHDGTTKLLSTAEAHDGWRRRLSYAITSSMTASGPSPVFDPNAGAIIVNNVAGVEQTNRANFIVLSHGEDGAGAHNAAGILVDTCSTTTVDADNCDDDATFVVISPAESRSYAFGNNAYNDDFAGYSTATAADTTKSCPGRSILRGIKANGDLICTDDLVCPAGHAMVGTLPDGAGADCQPVSLSCAPGEVLVSFTMNSAPSCAANMPGECSAGYIQRGTDNDPASPNYGKPICFQILNQCPAQYVQVGMGFNQQPICVPNFNSNCPGGQIQVGNNSDGSANCTPVNLNACPAGQYMYGMVNGSPLCSGDRTVNDNSCGAGQVVTGISGGNVICNTQSSDLNLEVIADIPAGSCNGGFRHVYTLVYYKNVTWAEAQSGYNDGYAVMPQVQAWSYSNSPYVGEKSFIAVQYNCSNDNGPN